MKKMLLFFGETEKKIKTILEGQVQKQLVIEVNEYVKNYRKEPSPNEILQIKKDIMLRLFFTRFAPIGFLTLFLLLAIIV